MAGTVARAGSRPPLPAPPSLDVRAPSEPVEAARLSRLVRGLQALAVVEPVPAAVLSCLAEQAMAVSGAYGCAVERLEGEEMVCAAAMGTLAGSEGTRLPAATALSGLVARSAGAALCTDVATDARVDAAVCRRLGIASMALVPLVLDGEVLAVVKVAAPMPSAFGAVDVEALDHLAAAAASRLLAADALTAAEAALTDARRSEDRLRAVMDAALDGHSVYDPVFDATGDLVDLRNGYINPIGASLRGLAAERWKGASLLALAREQGNTAIAETFLQVARTGRPWTGRPRIATGRGLRTFALSAVPTAAAPCGVMVSFRDVEEETRAALALATTARMLDETQALAGIGSWEWDLVRGELTWSAGLKALFGLVPWATTPTAEETVQLVHPEDREHFARTSGCALARGGRASVAYRVLTPSGEVRHLLGWAHVERSDGRPTHAWGGAQDVTERVEHDRALAASEERFRLALDRAPVGIALLGFDGLIVTGNPALARLLGEPTAGSGQPTAWRSLPDTAHPDDLPELLQLGRELRHGEREAYERDARLLRADGSVVWAGLTVTVVRDADGVPRSYLAHVADATARVEQTEALHRAATTDPLTGLANRRAWEQGLLSRHDAVIQGQGSLVIAIVDLDHFKVYNDTFGHPAGDRLLVEAAQAWTAWLAETAPAALLARLGGEEFGVALPAEDLPAARELLVGLCALVPRGQTASAGVTAATAQDEPRTLMARADAALYAAKRSGRNRVEAFSRS